MVLVTVTFTVDWWAVGIILFEFLSGIPPFYDEETDQVFQNIIQGDLEWPCDGDEMSAEAMDLITQLLRDDPKERLGAGGAQEVKAHPFFAGVEWDTLLENGVPPFVPGDIKEDNPTYYFDESEASQEQPTSAEFRRIFEDDDEESGSEQGDQFDDFWCINVSNLKEKNFELLEELIAKTPAHSRTHSTSHILSSDDS